MGAGRWEEVTSPPDLKKAAFEVTDEDDGMTFEQAVDVMQNLEQLNSPTDELGSESCTASYHLQNRDGYYWSLVVTLMDASGTMEENDYPQAYGGAFLFTIYTADGLEVMLDWIEKEIL